MTWQLTLLPAVYLVETNDVLCNYVMQYEVFNKLSHIEGNKSPGRDDIPNWFLPTICHIFNSSIIAGCVPSLWNEPIIAGCVPSLWNEPIIAGCVPSLWKEQTWCRYRNSSKTICDRFRSLQHWPKYLSHTHWSTNGFFLKLRTVMQDNLVHHETVRLHMHSFISYIWRKALDDHNSIRPFFVNYIKAFDHVDHSLFFSEKWQLWTFIHVNSSWCIPFC